MLCNLQIECLIIGAFVSQFVCASPIFRPPKPKPIFPPKPDLLSGPNVCSYRRPVVKPICVQNPGSCLGQRPSVTFITDYRCCPGYKRFVNNTCIKAVTVATIVDEVKRLRLKKFLTLLEKTDIKRMLANDGNLTVFVPSDVAFERFLGMHSDVKDSTHNLTLLLRRHIVVGVFSTRDIKQDQLLLSLELTQKLRVTWSVDKKIALIQGAKIVKPDQFAKNGVIHVIDKVIERTTKSVIQYISSRMEIKKFVELTKRLGTNLKGPVTLFVPTNSAFAKLSSKIWSQVSSNESCLRRVIEHHLVARSVHIAGLSGKMVLNSREGSKLVISTTNNETTVANSTIITRDVSATNGVVHVISDVIIPFGLTCQSTL